MEEQKRKVLVEGLEKLAIADRVAVARRLADYLDDGSPADRRGATILIGCLVQDAAVDVRAAIAEAVAANPALPREVALRLAHDVDRVALPILEICKVLTAEDLGKLAHATSEAGRVALARRPDLTGAVRWVLIELGSGPVLVALVENQSTTLAGREAKAILQRTDGLLRSDSQAVLLAMAARGGVDVGLAIRILDRLVARFREVLLEDPANGDAVAAVIADARHHIILRMADTLSDGELEATIAALKGASALNDMVIIAALRAHKRRFIVAALAARAGIPRANVEAVLASGAETALTALYRRCAMAPIHEPAVRHLLLALARDVGCGPDLGEAGA
ncbi:MAG: DUF2336 domain-containing protein [Azospirillaceae bacterium]|nr:DUF2336 domain-containing protein [Azospirillaceae bacterium]